MILSFLSISISAQADTNILDTEQVKSISNRVWETRQSKLLANPTFELCKHASSEIWVRGQYIEETKNKKKMNKCNRWANLKNELSISEKAMQICERFASKRTYTYTYLDDNGLRTVFDSKELECYERASHLLKNFKGAMDCRRKENGVDSNILPTSRGRLQRAVYCNKSMIKNPGKDNGNRLFEKSKQVSKKPKGKDEKNFIEQAYQEYYQ